MAYFLMKLIPPRPTFPGDASDEELAAMDRHQKHVRRLIHRRLVWAAGPVSDASGTWGVAIAEAGNAAEARAHFDADPVIKANLGFRWETYPMASLMVPDV